MYDESKVNSQQFSSVGSAVYTLISEHWHQMVDGGLWPELVDGKLVLTDIIRSFSLEGLLNLSLIGPGDGAISDGELMLDVLRVTSAPEGDCDLETWVGCASTDFDLGYVQGFASSGVLDMNVQGMHGFTVPDHGVSLDLGSILAHLAEYGLLPVLLNAVLAEDLSAEAFETYLAWLLGGPGCTWGMKDAANDGACCENFRQSLSGAVLLQAPDTELLFLEPACEALVTHGANYLRAGFEALGTASSQDWQLGSADTCVLTDVDGDQTVEQLGSADLPCPWHARFSLSDDPVELSATFSGHRVED